MARPEPPLVTEGAGVPAWLPPETASGILWFLSLALEHHGENRKTSPDGIDGRGGGRRGGLGLRTASPRGGLGRPGARGPCSPPRCSPPARPARSWPVPRLGGRTALAAVSGPDPGVLRRPRLPWTARPSPPGLWWLPVSPVPAMSPSAPREPTGPQQRTPRALPRVTAAPAPRASASSKPSSRAPSSGKPLRTPRKEPLFSEDAALDRKPPHPHPATWLPQTAALAGVPQPLPEH